MEVFNNASPIFSTLSVGCLIGDTSITITNPGAFSTSGNYRILIDNEIMLATGRSGSVISVTRAQEGTAAAAHVLGSLVCPVITAGALVQLKADAGAGVTVSQTNILYVSLIGSDVTGDGSIGKPFSTYKHAASVAVSNGAASGNLWAVSFAPGAYTIITDGGVLNLLPYVTIVGFDPVNIENIANSLGSVTLSCASINLDASWSGLSTGISGISFARIIGDINLDYDAVGATNGFLKFTAVNFQGGAFFTDGVSTTELQSCTLSSDSPTLGFQGSNNGTLLVKNCVVGLPTSLAGAAMTAYNSTFTNGFNCQNFTEALDAYNCNFLGLGTGSLASLEVDVNAIATVNLYGGYTDSIAINGTATTSQVTAWGTAVKGVVRLNGTGALYQSTPDGIGTSLVSLGGAPAPVIKGSGSAPGAGYVEQSDGSGGLTWVVLPAGGGGASGDNGAAVRANRASSLPSGSNGAQVLSDLAVTDGAEGLFAGTAIALTGSHGGGKAGPTKLYFAGTTVAHGEGGLFSFDCGGQRVEFLGSLAGPHNPDDMITFSVGNNPDFNAIATVGKGGMDVWEDGYFQGESFSALQHTSGGEDWTGARIAVIPNFNNNAFLYWTAPTPGKVYSDSVDGGFFGTALTIAETPTAICKDNDNQIWISFIGSSKVRKYTTTLVDGSLTQSGADISNAGTINVVDMLFDGAFIWTLSSGGVLAKLNASDGSFVASISLTSVSALSRIAFDGESIWVTSAGATAANWSRIDPDTLGVVLQDSMSVSNITTRGIAVIPGGGGIYVVGRVTSGGTAGHLYLGIWHPPQGDFPLYQRQFSRAFSSSVVTSFAALNIQTQPGNFTSGFNDHRSVEYTITAMANNTGDSLFAWFKQRARILPGGTLIAGDPVSVDDSPKLNAIATTDGIGFALTMSGSFLVGTITQTIGNLVFWSFMIEETNADSNRWY